jgi:hypothetical protein
MLQLRLLIVVLGLFISFVASAVTVPTLRGFSYRARCDEAIKGSKPVEIEVVKKTLPGKEWPEGVKENFDLISFNVLNMIDRNVAEQRGEPAKVLNSGYKYFAKPLHQLKGIANIGRKYLPHGWFFVEVGTIKIMRDFDLDFMGDRYEEFHIEGNDERGINLGLYLDKRLPLEVEVHSHKNLVHDATGDLVFSRDFPAYILSEKGAKKPLLVLLGTHFKSQRPSDGDPTGSVKRTIQSDAAALIIETYRSKYPGTLVATMGDFNNEMRLKTEPEAASQSGTGSQREQSNYRKGLSPEFESLRRIGMLDAFEAAPESTEWNRRGTHFFFQGKRLSMKQLDAILIDEVSVQRGRLKSAFVLPHVDDEGYDLPPPKSYEEREQRGSDHLAIEVILDLTK